MGENPRFLRWILTHKPVGLDIPIFERCIRETQQKFVQYDRWCEHEETDFIIACRHDYSKGSTPYHGHGDEMRCAC